MAFLDLNNMSEEEKAELAAQLVYTPIKDWYDNLGNLQLNRFCSCGNLCEYEYTLTTKDKKLKYYYCKSCDKLFTA